MNEIFVAPNNECLRAASVEDCVKYRDSGWRELTQDEITAAGMAGYEKYVSPLTAIIREDGSIAFTPPDAADVFAQRLTYLRSARNDRLSATDKYLLPDYPITANALEQVKAYRAALRDLPAQPGAPWDGGGDATPWPTKPEI